MRKRFNSTVPARHTNSGTTSRVSASIASPKESDIQKACIDWLNTIPGVKVWRQNTGAQVSEYKGKKRFMRFGQKGQADITGIALGVRVEIEVKRPGQKPSDDQRDWLRIIGMHFGISFWTDSIERCVTETREAFLLRDWEWRKNWEL